MFEATRKKAEFLRLVADRLGVSVDISNHRIETAPKGPPFDVITARACAGLDLLLDYAQHFAGPSTVCLFLKGQKVGVELTEARKVWRMKVRQHPSLTSPFGAVLEIREFRNVRSSAKTRPRVLVIANQKGGVGKTTTAINLGTALAAVGEPTLVIDIDPQGNASTGLGVPRSERKLTTYDVLMGQATIAESILPTRIPKLSLVPSTVDLTGAELELIDVERRNFRLKDALAEYSAHGSSPFSYVLIDCPPSLTLLTVNAMAAADAVVVPLQCEFFALEGLSQLLKTIDLVRANLNPVLEIQGIVLTMFDKRNKLSDQVAADVREHMGPQVYNTVIPRNVRISEAPSHGLPALVYDLRCPGSQAYIKLAGELIQRERMRTAA